MLFLCHGFLHKAWDLQIWHISDVKATELIKHGLPHLNPIKERQVVN